jgi:hypothetical protein
MYPSDTTPAHLPVFPSRPGAIPASATHGREQMHRAREMSILKNTLLNVKNYKSYALKIYLYAIHRFHILDSRIPVLKPMTPKIINNPKPVLEWHTVPGATSYKNALAKGAVRIFDLSGRSLGTPAIAWNSGYATATWNFTDRQGKAVPAGTYLIRIAARNGAMVQRVTKQ